MKKRNLAIIGFATIGAFFVIWEFTMVQHVNSVEEHLFNHFADSIPIDIGGVNFYKKLSINEKKKYEMAFEKERKSARADLKIKMIPRIHYKWVCAPNLCPCSEERGGAEFKFVLDESTAFFYEQDGNVERLNGYEMSIVLANGEKKSLPLEEKKVGNDSYSSFTLDASNPEYSNLNDCKLRVVRIFSNGTKDSLSLFLNYNSSRGNSASFVYDLIISNKPF